MPPKTPSLSVHISYRLDGSKVAYMRSREHDVCEYYPEFLERDLLYLQLPSKWMYDTTLQSLPEGKIQCRWFAGIVDDDLESGLLEQIAGQVEFLNNPGAAQLLKLLEISKIELAQPTPATQSPAVQWSEIPHRSPSVAQARPSAAPEPTTGEKQGVHGTNYSGGQHQISQSVRLEISKIELARPTPATQSPVVQPSDLPHQPRSEPQTSAPVAAETAARAEQETHAGDDGQRAPAAPTDPKVAELEDLLAQHKACYAKHSTENAGEWEGARLHSEHDTHPDSYYPRPPIPANVAVDAELNDACRRLEEEERRAREERARKRLRGGASGARGGGRGSGRDVRQRVL
ncbi:uncharacterized protein B0H18DRAFT_1123009 [Fomitopsis serialis]|uniref:uncharacterized protein n=1 Tax=Fomitopsis serialis TaxID=139415 RepID=UPI002008D179|nr:uncharacterized protein B0H18DRAFT_1123009 [Neoantrodia serialis]KAH9918499.1 hypothetical protein B0H18DRAFT_1123009 [Neoantrodia serialis]